MTLPLAARISTNSTREIDAGVRAFATMLAQQSNALAVLFYGSNLRTGSREGVLDFYILQAGPAETGIWPRVSYREWDYEGETLRAKIASMSLAMFDQAASGRRIDTTIWARFVQPCAIIWSANEQARAELCAALGKAAQTAARLAAALGPAQGEEADYWSALFRATYKAELRVEKPGRENSILEANAAHFAGLLPAALESAGIEFKQTSNQLRPQLSNEERRAILAWWGKRRRLGKLLNIRRLVRATRTFDGAARYAAWKVERHTGIAVEVTPWREKHPILSAPLIWLKVWRAKRGL